MSAFARRRAARHQLSRRLVWRGVALHLMAWRGGGAERCDQLGGVVCAARNLIAPRPYCVAPRHTAAAAAVMCGLDPARWTSGARAVRMLLLFLLVWLCDLCEQPGAARSSTRVNLSCTRAARHGPCCVAQSDAALSARADQRYTSAICSHVEAGWAPGALPCE